jgi:hypothetical protein
MSEFWNSDAGKYVVGGLIGLAGAVITTLLAWGKEYWFYASKRRSEAEYLAMRLVLVFDEFINDCYNAVHDPLTQDQEGCSESTVPDPTLSLPTDGDYKALPRHLMFKALSMPSKVAGVKEGAASAWEISGPPDYEELFEYRREHWSKLGLEALELIDALCREFKVPPPDRPEYYEPRQSFLREIAKVHEEERKRQEASSRMMESFLASQAEKSGTTIAPAERHQPQSKGRPSTI